MTETTSGPKRGVDSVPRLRSFIEIAPVVATILAIFAFTGDPAPGDIWIAHRVQDLPLGSLLADVGVFVAAPWAELAIWGAAAVVALRARNWALLLAAILVIIALAVNPVLKEIFARARPTAADVVIRRPAGGYGFPSGHTSTATLMYGYAAVVFVVVWPKPAGLWLALAAVAIALIGFERVYDGAHWPSDVAGGFISGALLVVGCVALSEAFVSRVRAMNSPPGS